MCCVSVIQNSKIFRHSSFKILRYFAWAYMMYKMKCNLFPALIASISQLAACIWNVRWPVRTKQSHKTYNTITNLSLCLCCATNAKEVIEVAGPAIWLGDRITSSRVWFGAVGRGVTLELAWGPWNSHFVFAVFYFLLYIIVFFLFFFLIRFWNVSLTFFRFFFFYEISRNIFLLFI